jgi:hypothetical protein
MPAVKRTYLDRGFFISGGASWIVDERRVRMWEKVTDLPRSTIPQSTSNPAPSTKRASPKDRGHGHLSSQINSALAPQSPSASARPKKMGPLRPELILRLRCLFSAKFFPITLRFLF